MASSLFKMDEGYHSRTPPGSEAMMVDNDNPTEIDRDALPAQHSAARQWLLSQPVDFRSLIARELLFSLPNAAMSEIVRDAHGRLHFDPVMYLPQEIISIILEYTDAKTLVSAAMVSRAWEQRSKEPRLWRRLFIQEGWTYDPAYLELFEVNARRLIKSLRSLLRESQSANNTEMDSGEQESSRRIDRSRRPIRLWTKNGRLGFEWLTPSVDNEEDREPAGRRYFSIVSHNGVIGYSSELRQHLSSTDNPRRIWTPLVNSFNLLQPTMSPSFDWMYLHKQRIRLEENWSAGRYTNFRLPRHDHPEEAHTQCVYSMQFSNKHVVTGSRDRTVRIWDLETKRLKLPPLTGHRGSVLCLQFDESPDQDILVSGGSDSDVIIWTFSTGHMFKRLKNAHTDSVLNLCFDHRYLVTCSKDKTIKLWNRKRLLPMDPEYPPSNQANDAEFPEYIVNLPDVINSAALNRIQPLDRYSLVMTFNGHNAAVNAIQIYDDQIVSASGDRKIFLWSINRGQLLQQFGGHSKGIACVQYDGKRIVSGSSDKTVRITDSRTGADLAVLYGHRDLVRTVQADFTDPPGSEVHYKAQAKAQDQELLKLKRDGTLRLDVSWKTGGDLPLGGGGNEWSKIVSGSYDETVMVWKKGRRGRWTVIRELRQEDAMQATAVVIANREDLRDDPDLNQPARNIVSRDIHGFNEPRISHSLRATGASQAEHHVVTDHSMSGIGNAPAQDGQARVPASHGQEQPLHIHVAPTRLEQDEGSGSSSQAARILLGSHPQPNTAIPLAGSRPAYDFHTPPQQQLNSTQQPFLHTSAATASTGQAAARPLDRLTAAITTPNQFSTQSYPITQPLNPAAEARFQHIQRTRPRGDRGLIDDDVIGASRVFKLQFNSRYIICCSQQPVIVGWDFANGDRELEEASEFFGMPRGN